LKTKEILRILIYVRRVDTAIFTELLHLALHVINATKNKN